VHQVGDQTKVFTKIINTLTGSGIYVYPWCNFLHFAHTVHLCTSYIFNSTHCSQKKIQQDATVYQNDRPAGRFLDV